MRVTILQPSYLPWLGFFEQMSRSDKFVLLDDVQYTRRDWRNPVSYTHLTLPTKRIV